MRESSLSQRAAAESLPLRDAFSVLFFVSVGMLFDPYILVEEPLHVLSVVAIIVFGKSVAAFLIVLFFKYPLNTAPLVSASLAQIGEFSFILAGIGVALGILPLEGQNYIFAGALISIAINLLVFNFVNPTREKVEKLGRLGVLSVCDDGTDLDALTSVGMGYAEVAVFAIPDAFQASIIVDAIKKDKSEYKSCG